MSMSKQTLNNKIENIIKENLELGYRYRMSDYASSYLMEERIEKEGLKEIKKVVRKIIKAINET